MAGRAISRSALLGVTVVVLGCGAACRRDAPVEAPAHELVATIRSEPRTFNRLLATDRVSSLLGTLTTGALVRIDAETQRVEPWLAERWTISDSRLEWTMSLRPNVRFSDGTPMTADDVVFSASALYDPAVASVLAQSIRVGDRPLAFSAIDPSTVRVTLPSPYGPGPRILAGLPILPKHRLAAALAAGTLREAWGLSATPAEMVGLGPFQIAAYEPGRRVLLTRNPHYWRMDGDGTRLPYLDRLVLDIVPDLDGEMLRLQSGRADISTGELRPEDLAMARRLEQQGRLRVHELGVGMDADFFWINARPAKRAADRARAWLYRDEFRQAISRAVDRDGFVKTVLLGAGVPICGPVTPANRAWYNAALVCKGRDMAAAQVTLASLGLADRDGDGRLEQADGSPVRFSLLTQQGHALRERAAAVIQRDLAGLGVVVDVVALDTPALYARFQSGDFDAAFFGVQSSDSDPTALADFWVSSGAFHVWNPSQAAPASDWEARMDAMMAVVARESDSAARKRAYDDVQAIFAEHEPALFFAAPVAHIAVSRRVENVRLGRFQPYVLWNADSLRATGRDVGPLSTDH